MCFVCDFKVCIDWSDKFWMDFCISWIYVGSLLVWSLISGAMSFPILVLLLLNWFLALYVICFIDFFKCGLNRRDTNV